MKVKLTTAQADTLLALRSAMAQFIDTTGEIACYDNSAPGTGRRLEALNRKGLCVRVGWSHSQRAGFRWEFTPTGRKVAEEVHLTECVAKKALKEAGQSPLGSVDLAGEYEAQA